MNVIRPNRLLSALIAEDEQSFFTSLSPFAAEKHTILHAAGLAATHVYFPSSGMISLLTVMNDGHSIETAAVGYDSAVGFNSALSGRNSNCESIVQVTMTSMRINRAQFCQAYDRSPGVRKMIHTANEMLVEQTQQTAACHALHEANSRFARWLLQTHDYAGQDELDITQDFVSEMMGVRRTTVSIIAASLQEAGLIRYSRGHVRILSRPGLEKLSCECYATLARDTVQMKPRAVPPGAPPQDRPKLQ
jgi:CRP-like cAMP-binding protein